MSYQNVIARYDRMYREADLGSILDLWAASAGPLNVYVHSPFCPSICRFCYYKGVEFSFGRDSRLYDRYYREYLPGVVAPFRDLLVSRRVGNYFFGGGTPSLMSSETMTSVFDLFPGFREVRSKTFEIHPAAWSEDQLDTLAEHGFNCCIVGIQSFDESVLRRQGRIHVEYEKIAALAAAIRQRGMYLAADLIYRMDEIDADDIFRRDLDLVETLHCDVISLQLNYDDIHNEAWSQRFFEMVLGSALAKGYRWEQKGPLSINLKKTLKCFRYVRNAIPDDVYQREIFPFIFSLDEASKISDREDLPSVIGFGSYRNPRKNTFSNIRDAGTTVEYIEVNDDWKPRYYVTFESYQRDFFDECVKRLDRMREIGPPPRGMKIWFENTIPRERDDKIIRRIKSDVGMSVTWDYSTPRTQEYVAKLKSIFPHWEWWED